jgi:hypothetical protein
MTRVERRGGELVPDDLFSTTCSIITSLVELLEPKKRNNISHRVYIVVFNFKRLIWGELIFDCQQFIPASLDRSNE